MSDAVEAFRRLISGNREPLARVPDELRLAGNAHPASLHDDWPAWVRENLHILRAKDLICWCPATSPCHADILLELANAT
jgi:hypothetical protein